MLADSLPLLFDAGCRCLAGVPQAPSNGCYRRNIGECEGANGERRGVVGDEAWAKEVHTVAHDDGGAPRGGEMLIGHG